MIEELNILMNNHSTIEVRAYFKVRDSLKHYYDYQFVEDGTALNGSYDLLPTDELLYYLKEQAAHYELEKN